MGFFILAMKRPHSNYVPSDLLADGPLANTDHPVPIAYPYIGNSRPTDIPPRIVPYSEGVPLQLNSFEISIHTKEGLFPFY